MSRYSREVEPKLSEILERLNEDCDVEEALSQWAIARLSMPESMWARLDASLMEALTQRLRVHTTRPVVLEDDTYSEGA
jgi:hypothetical protein